MGPSQPPFCRPLSSSGAASSAASATWKKAGDGVAADERRVDVGDGALDLVEGGELGAGQGRPDGDGGPDAARGAAGGARAAEREETAGGARRCAPRGDRLVASDAAEVGDAGRHYSRDAGSLNDEWTRRVGDTFGALRRTRCEREGVESTEL